MQRRVKWWLLHSLERPKPSFGGHGNPGPDCAFIGHVHRTEERTMGFGRGALLWLLGIPLPIIILLALFWR
jgi:hypothetical protein